MTDQMKTIIEYLENSYSGAKMFHDEECMLRISRALAAFKADVETNIFTEEFLASHYSGNII